MFGRYKSKQLGLQRQSGALGITTCMCSPQSVICHEIGEDLHILNWMQGKCLETKQQIYLDEISLCWKSLRFGQRFQASKENSWVPCAFEYPNLQVGKSCIDVAIRDTLFVAEV